MRAPAWLRTLLVLGATVAACDEDKHNYTGSGGTATGTGGTSGTGATSGSSDAAAGGDAGNDGGKAGSSSSANGGSGEGATGEASGGAIGGGAGGVIGGAGAAAQAGAGGDAGAPSAAACPPPDPLPTTTASVPAPDLYWTFDDADLNANEVQDRGAGQHDGTIVAGVTTGVSGIVGESFEFDGATGSVTAPATALKSSPISISVWVHFAGHVTTGGMFMNLGNGSAAWSGLGMEVRTTDQVMFATEGGNMAREIAVFGCLEFGRWVHYLGVFDGSTTTLYRDGVDVYSKPVDYTTIPFGSLPLVLGHHSLFVNRYFAGRLDEFAIWSQALTAQEVVAVYRAGATGNALIDL